MSKDTREVDDEQTIAALRRILTQGEPLPPGVRSRWEAALRREALNSRQGMGAAVVLGMTVILGALAILGPEGLEGWVGVMLVVGAAFYAVAVRMLLNGQGEDDLRS